MDSNFLNRLYEPNVLLRYTGDKGDVVFTFNNVKGSRLGVYRIGIYNYGLNAIRRANAEYACVAMDKLNTNIIYVMFFEADSKELSGSYIKGTNLRVYKIQEFTNSACITITPDDTLKKVISEKFANKPLILRYDQRSKVHYVDASKSK